MEGHNLSSPPKVVWRTQKHKILRDYLPRPRRATVLARQLLFFHWVLNNLPASLTELAEGATTGTEGDSDFGKPGHGKSKFSKIAMPSRTA